MKWIAAVAFCGALIAPSIAVAQSAWPQVTIGNAGLRFNEAAGKLDVRTRVSQNKCLEKSCTYAGHTVTFLATGDTPTKASEIMLPIGTDTDPAQFLISIGVLMAMLEPKASRAERRQAIERVMAQIDEVLSDRKATTFLLRDTAIKVIFAKGLGGFVQFARAG